jgi:hypothetical protein
MAKLWRYSDGLEVASSDGEDSAGARVSVMLAEMSKEEEEWGSEAYPQRRCTFYSPRRAATPSCASARRRWIGRLSELHRAASISRKKKTETVSWLGCGAVVLGRLGWALAQVSVSLYFFLLIHFFLFLVFCFEF